MKKILVFSLCLVLGGCAYMADQRRGKLMQLEIGMDKAKVISVMGQPYGREVYKQPDGSIVEYLLYVTKYAYPYEEKTPVAFIDGKVIGWGQSFYQKQEERYKVDINR